MKLLYSYQTSRGLASIRYTQADQRFHAFFTDENLGSYASAEQAIDDLTGGHTWSHSSGVDTSLLDIPDDLSEWDRASWSPM